MSAEWGGSDGDPEEIVLSVMYDNVAEVGKGYFVENVGLGQFGVFEMELSDAPATVRLMDDAFRLLERGLEVGEGFWW